MTDAIAAAGQPEGTYELGDRTVHVADDVCRLDDGTLAGSVLTMDQAVRNLLELGFGVPQAVAAAATAPVANAAENPFSLTQIKSAYQVAGKDGESNCGGKKGENHCGGKKDGESHCGGKKDKKGEASCGENKCGGGGK